MNFSPTSNNPRFTLIILAAASILMITMGMRMALGLFVQPIHQETALSITSISFAMAVTQLMWGVAQPVTGALADRYSAWPVLLWGTLLLAAGFALAPLFPSTLGLTFTMGIMVAFGAGAGSFSILISQVSNKLPQKIRGLASGIVNAGGSFGQFLFAPLVQGLIIIPAFGWQGAMYALAIISLICLPIARWLSHGDTAIKNTPSAVSAPEQSLKRCSPRLKIAAIFCCISVFSPVAFISRFW
ncbi:MFS transporter [Testudinibacter aquarius]|uniref:MFS transporter n=1 Tax=Testudinibacter aquarius TaxID=1524974 RepID=A0A4R3XYD2_9PAST|nr:MFS transporter [Testudinibacter aquarius]TCV84815.1 MFS transporter [Testudinibacter aquarius]